MRTLSAIDWPALPLDLPLDVWVLQYQLVNRSVTDPWVAAGHELYVYHCIEPSSLGFMMPVSTPCNAIVYGSGRVPLRAMMASGAIIDVVGVITVTAAMVLASRF